MIYRYTWLLQFDLPADSCLVFWSLGDRYSFLILNWQWSNCVSGNSLVLATETVHKCINMNDLQKLAYSAHDMQQHFRGQTCWLHISKFSKQAAAVLYFLSAQVPHAKKLPQDHAEFCYNTPPLTANVCPFLGALLWSCVEFMPLVL